jgi:hypothetical protein
MPAHLAAFVKTIFALAILAVFAIATNNAFNMPQSVRPVASDQDNAGKALEDAASYIEARLAAQGFSVERRRYQHEGRQVCRLEVSVVNVIRNKSPDRIFIVGAHYDAARGGGTAVVLDLARMLKGMHLSLGTELKFVFFFNEETPGPGNNGGNFIAFVGTHAASEQVRRTLAAFKAASRYRAPGQPSVSAYPAIVIADTVLLRYPYHHAVQDAGARLDYQNTARAVEELAKVIKGIAGPIRM